MFYYTELPVFGQMGSRSRLDTNVHPPIIRELHCLIDVMPTSDIFTIFPAIIVARELASKLEQVPCSGFEMRNGLFEPSDAFRHFNGAKPLPDLCWCHITGRPYSDDFGFAEAVKLIVSAKAKDVIESCKHQGVSFIAGDRPPSNEEIEAKIWADAAKVAQDLKAKGKPRTGWFVPPES